MTRPGERNLPTGSSSASEMRGERAYARAGVDLEAAARAVSLIGELSAGTPPDAVVSGVGGFAGLYDIGNGRLLAAATDGVGTKTQVARAAGVLDTIGIDLVAMSANDVVCTGARPLFFLDYVAVGDLVPERVAQIVSGVAEGCRRAGCALVGGETAEHPGTMAADDFDLAGFCVGAVDARETLGPHRVQAGDALIGLASSGLHANGFSLVRKAVLGGRRARRLDERVPGLGGTLAEALLAPTEIYVPVVLELSRAGLIGSAAHITGGGLTGNIPRALPEGTGAVIDASSWPRPPIFDMVAEAADLDPAGVHGVLNMGIGMVLAVESRKIGAAIDEARVRGARPVVIGEVRRGSGVEIE